MRVQLFTKDLKYRESYKKAAWAAWDAAWAVWAVRRVNNIEYHTLGNLHEIFLFFKDYLDKH